MSRFQLLLWLSLAICSTNLAAQAQDNVLNCAADELHERLRINDPSYRKLEDILEREWSDHAKRTQRSLPPPYTLPIVFHIVHDNGPENISDTDIIRSLEFTNQAFANTDYYEQGTGVNTGVQFCLAQRSPDNQPTTGINRVVSATYSDLEATAEDRDMKDLSRWEPREYINVWVVKEICGLGFGCGVAGYAYYPGAHGGGIDGIVVEARWLTTNEARASVLVHELGHYLGIRHTFDGGCTNDDCTLDGDRVCDTPPDQSKAAVPCTGTANSCTTDTDSGFATDQNDMFINYMDYGYWNCYSAFTQGQADRMSFFLDGTRSSLLSSPGCLFPCPAPVAADFTGGDVTVEIGTTINFLNSSINGNGYTWKIDDVTEGTTFNYSHLFDTEGNFTLTLLAGGSPPLCLPDSIEQRVRVVCSLTASFDPSGSTTVGIERTFPNLSNLADTYEWRLDGNLISTDEDLTFTFPTPGLFNLCLESENAWCSETYCRLLFVNPPPDTTSNPGGNCGESFVFGYQSPFGGGQDGSLTTVIPDGTGGYFAAGYYGRQALVMHLDQDGSILWQSQLFPNGSGSTVSKLILDGAGNLAGIGRNNASAPGTQSSASFIFQMDPTNGSLLWAHDVSFDFADLQINDFVQSVAGAPYTLVGEVGNDGASGTGGGQNGFILQLSPADGLAIGGLRMFFTEEEAVFDRIIWQNNRNRFYVSGKQESVLSPGWLLLSFDATANLLSGSVIPTGNATNTTNALSQDGNETVFTTSSLNSSGDLNDISVYRLDANESLNLSTVIATSNLQILTNVETTAGGYLISSLSNPGQLLFELNRSGAMNWARSYDIGLRSSVGFNFHPTNIAEDSGILLSGDRFDASGQIPAVLKLNPDGTAAADCIEVNDYPAAALPRQINLLDWFGQAEDLPIAYNDFGWEPASLEPAGGNCREECPEVDECSHPFILSYDEGDAVTLGGFTSVVPAGTRNYVGGSINGRAYVAALESDGTVAWQHYLELSTNSGFPNVIVDLIIDSDGMLVGIGRKQENADDRIGFIFRIDPLTGNLLWNKALAGGLSGVRHSFENIFQASPGSDYLVTGSFSMGEVTSLSAGSLYRFSPQTGDLVSSTFNVYHNTLSRGFEGAQIDATGELLYTVANQPAANGAVVVITAIDLLTNNVVWSAQYDQQNNAGDRLFGYSITLQNGSIFVLASDNGETDDAFYVLRADLMGTNPTLQEYALGSVFSVSQIEPFRNRLAISADFNNGQYLTLIDPTDGSVQFARSYFGYNELDNRANAMYTRQNQILLAGRMFNMGGTLLGVDSLGLPPAGCNPQVDDVQYTLNAVGVLQNSIPDVVPQRGQAQATNLMELVPGNLFLNIVSCPADCEEEELPDEICDNQIDDDGDGLVDCQDEDLIFDCCCRPDPTISLGSDQNFCGPVLRNFTAARFDTLFLSGVLTDTIYPDPNINGLVRLTFTEPGVYRLMAIDTCGRFAFDTLTLHPRMRPNLEIGPDTTLCSNAVIPLRAQPGFETYEWIDGTAEQEFTAFDAGVYWVKATDSCGTVQSDTMRVNIDLASTIELGPDTLICPGDTITFSLSGFSNYQWSQSSFIDCTNCPTVRFAPTSDTLLIVSAEQGPGCIASDSLRVRLVSTLGTSTSTNLCAGDTLFVGNQLIISSGTYFDTIPSGNCFRIDTLMVNLLQDTTISDTIIICNGDSTMLFGRFEDQAGTYSRSFTRGNGCDSLQEFSLLVRDTFLTVQNVSICAGDSTLIFGQFETQPGPYFSVLTSSGGCDSTLQVNLEVNAVTVGTEALTTACQGAAAGAGQVVVSQGLAPLSIAWSTGDTTTQISGIVAGNYDVTVTDANGCSATTSLLIPERIPPVLTLETTGESCPGDNDGTLTVTGDLSGQRLSITGVSGSGAMFSGIPPGDYLLQVTDSLGCDQSLPFTIMPATSNPLDLPFEIEVDFGDSITLVPNTNTTDLSTLTWATSGDILCVGCPTLTLRPEGDLTIVTTLPGSVGCPVADTTMLRVTRDNLLYVPNAFSPNADGVNDVFRIYPGGAVDEILRFAVYDRWGGQVFLRENELPTDALAGWDGTLPAGKDPSVGVYVYVVEVSLFNGEVAKLAGEVMVLR